MRTRTHLVALCAVTLACGGAVDLGTPYGPDASGGSGGSSSAVTTSGSGGSSSAATGSGTTSTTATGSGSVTSGSGSGTSGSGGTTGDDNPSSAGGSGGAPGGTCTHNGTSYPVGASYPAAANNCNTCYCESPEHEICTRCACAVTDSGVPRCGSGGTGGSTGGGSGSSAPSLCGLPFDSGPCEAAIPVFAYVNGACVARTYGGCQGNANRFNTVEECMATCDGRPDPRGCADGRVRTSICLACGPAGGCAKQAEVCAEPCPGAGPNVCAPGLSCYAGVCQVGPCL